MIGRPGRFLDLDDDGFIVNTCSLTLLPEGWDVAVDAAVGRAREHLGEDLHSVWVRGSAVTGEAVLGVSDLDLIVFSRQDGDRGKLWLPMPWSEEGLAPAGCTGVELPLASLGALGTERGSFCRFLLATQAVAVFGELDLPKYRVDRGICFVAPQLGSALQQAEEALESPLTDIDRADWTRWVAKSVVRSGLELVLQHESRYARDLWPCYQAFARVYPEHAPAMLAAVDAAVEPEAHPMALESLTRGLGPWLRDAWQHAQADALE